MAKTHADRKPASSSGPIAQAKVAASHQPPSSVEVQRSSAESSQDMAKELEPRTGAIFANVASAFQDQTTIQRQPVEAIAPAPRLLQRLPAPKTAEVVQEEAQPEHQRRLQVSDFQPAQRTLQRQIQPASMLTPVSKPVIQRDDVPAPPVRQGNQGLGGSKDSLGADLDVLYEEAAVAQQELYQKATAVAAATQGVAKLPDSLKGRERATEKTLSDYGGDAGLLFDIARGSIMYESYADLLKGLNTCQESMSVVREKNRFAQPTPAGYRDILLNVRMSNGHIAELQLHLAQILAVKSNMHKLYDQVREIEAEAKKAQRGLLPEEMQKIDQLNQESRKAFDAAFQQSQQSTPQKADAAPPAQ